MKIGLDCRMITHPGIGTYIKGLLDEFSRISDDFILFGNRADLENYRNFQIVEFNSPIYSLVEQLTGPKIFKNIDLLHVPHFNIPLGYNSKLVVTIHDLIYLFSPGFLRKEYCAFIIANVIKKANAIISVSNNTKKDLIQQFPNIDQNKIKVIYEAARPIFCKINDSNALNKTKNKYNLPDKFILYVGSIKKHKNLQILINAYTYISDKIDEKLVIIGRFDKKARQKAGRVRHDLWRKKESSSLSINNKDVIYLGEVPITDLVNIYNLASLFVMPSLYEGFGLPILEAMSCGLPVVSSNAASLPEVVGDAGILVDPSNQNEFADVIYNILTNETSRKNLIEKGFNQAEKFSWQKTSEKTLKIYENTLQ